MSTDVPTNRTNQRLWILVLLMAIVASVAGTVAFSAITSDRDAAQGDAKAAKSDTRQVALPAKDLADDVLKICRTGGEDAQPLRAAGLCGKATATKEVVEEATDAPSDPSDSTPPAFRYIPLTEAQLGPFAREYFARYCALGDRCKGDDGKSAPPVSDDRLATEVARQLPAVLSANCGGDCKGETGGQGPKGETGGQGPAGKDAGPVPVAVASFTCSGGLSPVTYTLVFTDGHTEERTCGELEPIPDPAPAE